MKKAFIGLVILILIIVGTYYGLIHFNKNNNVEENNNKYNEIISYKLVDTIGDYSIYENKIDDEVYSYIINTKDKEIIYSNRSNNIIQLYKDDYAADIYKSKYYVYNGYFINKVDNVISQQAFDDIYCDYITRGEFFKLCKNNTITIAKSNDKLGFLDIKTGKLLTQLKYNKIEEYMKNYFICDDKICLYKDNMIVEQLKVYDDIKYYENVGYVAIQNNQLKILNDNFESIKITEDIYKKLKDLDYIKELEIDVNDYFNYKGNDISGLQAVIIVDNGCGTYEKNQIKESESKIYVINKLNYSLKRLDPKLIEVNIGICDYFVDPYQYTEVETKKLSDYKISGEVVENIKTGDKYDIYMNFLDPETDEKEIKDLYVIQYDNNHNPERGYNGIYNKKEGYVIEPYYQDVSCSFHTDESYRPCRYSYTTLIDSKNLLSLKTGKILVETDGMNEISNGNFIGISDNKNIVYNSEGKELLKADYIGYSSKVGYITIIKNELKVYDENFKEKELNDLNEIILENAINIWSSSDLIANIDIKNNDYFKYNGELSGIKKILLSPCNEEAPIYLIENNKLTKLDVKLSDATDGCF